MAPQKPLMTPEQQMKIRQAVNQGAMEPMAYKDYCAMTPKQAEAKIKELEAAGTVDFSKPIESRNRQRQERRNPPKAPEQTPKTPEKNEKEPLKTADQAAAISRLVAEKRLNPVARNKWSTLTAKEAGKLIFVGREREARGEFAPKREEYTKAQEEKEPEKSTAQRNRQRTCRSRSGGMDR